jgi:hypothetical protein
MESVGREILIPYAVLLCGRGAEDEGRFHLDTLSCTPCGASAVHSCALPVYMADTLSAARACPRSTWSATARSR